MKQIEMYVDEIDDNRKQFTSELNELPMNEDKTILSSKILSLKMK